MSNDDYWDTDGTEYSGDVSLERQTDTPVAVDDPADVFLRAGSVDGDLKIVDAEWVYAGHAEDPVSVDGDPPAEVVAGDVEDVYAYGDGVAGDVVIRNPADVFIEPGAVAGELDVVGAEDRIGDPDEIPPVDDDHTAVVGWQQTRTVSTLRNEALVVSGRGNAVTVEEARGAIEVFVLGADHAVEFEDGRPDVSVYVLGYDSHVSLPAFASVADVTAFGSDNAVDKDPVPYDALIDTPRADAVGGTLFGVTKAVWQAPAPDRDVCGNPSCGAEADAVVERHRGKALVLFGTPVYWFEHEAGTYECEHCTADRLGDVSTTHDLDRLLQ